MGRKGIRQLINVIPNNNYLNFESIERFRQNLTDFPFLRATLSSLIQFSFSRYPSVRITINASTNLSNQLTSGNMLPLLAMNVSITLVLKLSSVFKKIEKQSNKYSKRRP